MPNEDRIEAAVLATLGSRAMTDVVMPRLSDSMEEGTIIKWLKQPGDEVRVGDPLAEIETDKATMTYEADDERLRSARRGRGRHARDRSDDRTPTRRAADAAKADAAPATDAGAGAADSGRRARSRPERPAVARRAGASCGARCRRVKASPVARRIAARAGRRRSRAIARQRTGRSHRQGGCRSRPRRRRRRGSAARGRRRRPADGAGAKGAVEVSEPTRTQALIARRMASAKATIPEFQVTVEVDAEAAFELREQLRGQADAAAFGQRPRRQGLRARAARPPKRQLRLCRRALRALLARSTSASPWPLRDRSSFPRCSMSIAVR